MKKDHEKLRLFSNIADAMGGVPAEIKERQWRLFDQVHADDGAGVRAALKKVGEGYDPRDVKITNGSRAATG